MDTTAAPEQAPKHLPAELPLLLTAAAIAAFLLGFVIGSSLSHIPNKELVNKSIVADELYRECRRDLYERDQQWMTCLKNAGSAHTCVSSIREINSTAKSAQ